MNGKIQIDGDKEYIDDLILITETLKFEPFIYKEGENTYLGGKTFEKIENAKDLSVKVKTFLTLISILPHFKTDRDIEPLKIVQITETLDGGDGKEEKIYDSDGILIRSKKTSKDGKTASYSYVGSGKIKIAVKTTYLATANDGTIIGGFATIESIKDHLLEIKSNSEALNKTAEYLKPFFDNFVKYSNNFARDKITEEILVVLSNPETAVKTETLKWVNLYRIYELIKESTRGERELKDKNWISREQIDSFKSTSNYYNRHSVFKVFKSKPKKRKMKLFEAQEIVSTLLSKYIEEKVQNQGSVI